MQNVKKGKDATTVDPSVDKLFESLAIKSKHVSPGLQQQINMSSSKYRSFSKLPQLRSPESAKRGPLENSAKRNIRRNLHSSHAYSSKTGNNPLKESITDIGEELYREMTREKDKLNRFLETKEACIVKKQ
jgi:hypothetical protein